MTDYLHALPPGYRIEEYELVRVLGSGGFGITYLGYDHHLDKAVAIKEYLPNDLAVRADNQSVLPKSTQDKADYEWGLARFLNEAQTLARFDHRHIIKIHRFFRAHGTGYSVMEYIEQYSAKGHQGPWTDIYGLGAVCYRCLAGEPPDDATERLREDPLVPAVKRCKGKASTSLLNAIDRALRMDEGERPQGVAEWREALAGDGKSGKGATGSAHKPATRPAKSSVTAPAGVSWSDRAMEAVIVALLGALAWPSWQLYGGRPGVDKTVAVVEQPADTQTGSQAGVALDTQEGNEAEATPGTAGTGQLAAEAEASPPAEEEGEVTRLLAAAEADLAARRLTSPAGNNAWEKYQRVLDLEPSNQDAITGIQRVMESYGELFDAALEQKDVEKAGTYLSRILDLNPDSPAAEELGRRLAATRKSVAKARELAGEMVSIPGGTFRMGDLSGERGDDEKPVRNVTVPAFRLGKYEVTTGQFRRFVEAMGYRTDAERNVGGNYSGCKRGSWDSSWRNPGFSVGDEQPVVCVSWNDAQAYIEWLAAQTGGNYRLPTEAEWEYAARAGSATEYSWGDDIGNNRANCRAYECGDSYEYTAPVGSFPANAWGLHDMHGNVWEWVQDCWNDSYAGAPTDGSAWNSGDCRLRVLRGGSWSFSARNLFSAHRLWYARAYRLNYGGFRLAQDE